MSNQHTSSTSDHNEAGFHNHDNSVNIHGLVAPHGDCPHTPASIGGSVPFVVAGLGRPLWERPRRVCMRAPPMDPTNQSNGNSNNTGGNDNINVDSNQCNSSSISDSLSVLMEADRCPCALGARSTIGRTVLAHLACSRASHPVAEAGPAGLTRTGVSAACPPCWPGMGRCQSGYRWNGGARRRHV